MLFTEELGLVLEVQETDVDYVVEQYKERNVPCILIGQSVSKGPDSMVSDPALKKFIGICKVMVCKNPQARESD